MVRSVPTIEFLLAVKGEDTILPLFQQVNGPQPFNGKALELLLAAISHSELKWDKWAETQQHHSFIPRRELRREVRPLYMEPAHTSTAVCTPVT